MPYSYGPYGKTQVGGFARMKPRRRTYERATGSTLPAQSSDRAKTRLNEVRARQAVPKVTKGSLYGSTMGRIAAARRSDVTVGSPLESYLIRKRARRISYRGR